MLQDLFVQIDNYCERTNPGLWSEPANALTNLAFVAAGLWGLHAARRREAGLAVEILAWLVVTIGVGSALFHTFANRLTMWADVLPIAIFTFAYTLYSIRRFLGFGWPATMGLFVGFYAVAGLITAMLPASWHAATNGSTGYLPALLALVVFGSWLIVRRHPAGWLNLAAAAIFIASVSFRIVDERVCTAFPLGTHFMWHVLNACLLGVLLAAAVRYGQQAGRRI